MKLKNCKPFLLLFMTAWLVFACSTPLELEGTWIGYQAGGPNRDWTLTIEHNQFELVCKDLNMWFRGNLKLNNNCSRHKMDLIISASAARINKGTTSLGIYEIEADTLVIVASEPGNFQRPFSFDQTQTSVVFVFEKFNQDE